MVWVEIQTRIATGQKMGYAEVIHTGVVYIPLLCYCLYLKKE